MTELVRLPPELIIHIVKFLKCQDVAALSQTCRRLYELTLSDCIWQHLSKQDYKLTSVEGWGEKATFREVYSNVLHPYAKCLGLWRNSDFIYGILIHIKMDQGQLIARLCEYPLTVEVEKPLLWCSPLFSVTLKDGKGCVSCRKGCIASTFEIKDNALEFVCKACEARVKKLGRKKMTSQWLKETKGLDIQDISLYFKDALMLSETSSCSRLQLKRIVPSPPCSGSPITLGMYKGTYGGHGIEVIHLTAADNGYKILGDKIWGDPYVPAGKISLHIDLRQPMTLTADQQDHQAVKSLEAETLESPFRFPPDAVQPFVLSPTVINDEAQLPNTCKARYEAKGQIASFGFINPSFCRAHFVVFSETYFGFYWIDLDSFSVYRLVEEDWS